MQVPTKASKGRRLPRGRGRGRDRGATLPEYALALAALVVASLGAIAALERASSEEVNNQAECVASRPPPPTCQLPPIVTTTTITPGPPPPPPPPPPADAVGSFSNPGSAYDPAPPGPNWQAGADFTLSSAGTPIEGAVVRVRVTGPAPFPSSPPFYASCTTNAAGNCRLTFDVPDTGLAAGSVVFRVDDVNIPNEAYPMPTYPGDVSIARPA
ncbi:MAG TPA: hypothetical protein VHK25_05860 [Acidimicrobiales bacterium]|nr:hypothetical protein [Acidimicrobiales bacterium]